ncbi:hypothetical protein COX58_01320 [archaeon CG_4_10_14_0_2_um_filter_Archaea_38_6]|nr:MAG: hypothetical protein COS83_04985 [archaeon CG07_land_8_20_14_0_80_38_8]PIU88927.1 MAG: hypothetical protein COS64_02045 [archaeon CG06_land_8_20_14_3_00_37_11]PJA22751.1 MAG: hypothetical protein COX58_01320 [archaeon CG_4_10_14_0_2_um_filter_Archaea_38_6]
MKLIKNVKGFKGNFIVPETVTEKEYLLFELRANYAGEKLTHLNVKLRMYGINSFSMYYLPEAVFNRTSLDSIPALNITEKLDNENLEKLVDELKAHSGIEIEAYKIPKKL